MDVRQPAREEQSPLATARRVKVCIPTTDGIAEVLGIVREGPALPQSLMRVGRKLLEPFGANGDYHEFVTAVIDRQFKHNKFRVDLSRPVETGRSWHLAMFIAHSLFHSGRLATAAKGQETIEYDAVVWATGEVLFDHTIVHVDEIPTKLKLSRDELMQTVLAERPVLLCLPRSDAEDPSVQQELSALASARGMTMLFAQDVGEALAILGLPRLAMPQGDGAAGQVTVPKPESEPTFNGPIFDSSLLPTALVFACGVLALVVALVTLTLLH